MSARVSTLLCYVLLMPRIYFMADCMVVLCCKPAMISVFGRAAC